MSENSVSFLVEQLPDDAKWWVEHLSPAARIEIDRLLKETGVQNFTKHWKEHRAELEDFERSLGTTL
ncbi:hypothetical protein NKJ50_09765 [Mesorhizobium sp. M0115]